MFSFLKQVFSICKNASSNLLDHLFELLHLLSFKSITWIKIKCSHKSLQSHSHTSWPSDQNQTTTNVVSAWLHKKKVTSSNFGSQFIDYITTGKWLQVIRYVLEKIFYWSIQFESVSVSFFHLIRTHYLTLLCLLVSNSFSMTQHVEKRNVYVPKFVR
jgi:hypothetical protein